MTKLGSHLRRLGRFCFFGGVLFLLLLGGFLWYVTTDSFQQLVRGRLIAAIEHATGGRAELGSFHVVPFRFRVEVRDLTIHGREAANEVPYVHVDSMIATVKLSSVLGGKIGFHSLALQHPVVHIIFHPDGSTNQPTPKQQAGGGVEQLFAVSIGRLEVHQGELLIQDQALPLDFTANDIAATMNYSFLHRRYSGRAEIGRGETQFDGYRPVDWSGQAGFTLDRDGIHVSSLKATSEGSRFLANGIITNFANPTFTGNYDLVLDLTQAGGVSRHPQLKAGKLSLIGSGSWSTQSFAAAGSFAFRDMVFQDQAISLAQVSASGKFSVDPQKVLLSKVEGKLWHGSFTSEAEISAWRSPRKPALTSKDVQRGLIKIRAKELALSEALASLGPQFRPMNQLRFAGDASGTAEIKWKDSIASAETAVAAAVERPLRLGAGQIPLNASLDATYNARTRELQINNSSASSPATQWRASGGLSSSSALKVSFTTTDLSEWQPVISEMFPAGLPFSIHGRASFNGTAAGNLSHVTLTGSLRAEDFDTRVARQADTPPMHWDSMAADIQISASRLTLHNAVLQHGNAILDLDGSAGLANWDLAPGSPLDLRLGIHDAAAAELAALAGYDQKISGTLEASGSLSGTAGRPQGQGRAVWSNGSIAGYGWDSASAQLQVNGSRLSFTNLFIAQGQARVNGHGSYDLSTQAVQANLDGTGFDVARLAALAHSRITIAGKFDFSAQAAGTIAEPQISADLHLRGLSFNGEVLGDYLLTAVAHGPALRLTGRSEFQTRNY